MEPVASGVTAVRPSALSSICALVEYPSIIQGISSSPMPSTIASEWWTPIQERFRRLLGVGLVPASVALGLQEASAETVDRQPVLHLMAPWVCSWAPPETSSLRIPAMPASGKSWPPRGLFRPSLGMGPMASVGMAARPLTRNSVNPPAYSWTVPATSSLRRTERLAFGQWWRRRGVFRLLQGTELATSLGAGTAAQLP